jgi:hypothetical protein
MWSSVLRGCVVDLFAGYWVMEKECNLDVSGTWMNGVACFAFVILGLIDLYVGKYHILAQINTCKMQLTTSLQYEMEFIRRHYRRQKCF